MRRRDFIVSLGGLTVAGSRDSKTESWNDQGKSEFLVPEQALSLPERKITNVQQLPSDWLVAPFIQPTRVYRSNRPNEIFMTNGLIRRTWRLRPDAATVSFDNLMTGASMLRAVSPEAYLKLDWQQELPVGGLINQPNYGFLRPEWVDKMAADPKAFHCTGFKIGPTKERFSWKRTVFSGSQPWPPHGASLTFRFQASDSRFVGVTVLVRYEMYDGIPLLAKWIIVQNGTKRRVRINGFINEVLAAVEFESAGYPVRWHYPTIHIESDYEFHGTEVESANKTVHWDPDPRYITQANLDFQTPCLLKVYPPIGPDLDILPAEAFESYRTYELVYDGMDRERNGLALRQMYRTLAPWITENPIYMHVESSEPEAIKKTVDQAAEVGFEMVIISFGCGFDAENENPDYVQKFKELVEYARNKKIVLGGYSLLASRDVGPENDVINPKTGTIQGAIFGTSPCLGSKWGVEYFRKLHSFYEKTGMGVLEHDGSYPGDVCASTLHPRHHGLLDSQWTQWKKITSFYKWCRSQGIYLNVPDWYFLSGSNKCAMEYREMNMTLPRSQQVIIGRQNVFDSTWEMTPSMGWMFVALLPYHRGGAAAIFEPLHEHLWAYQQTLAQLLGSGVQAAYRGLRLYDTDQTKEMVKRWVSFYKAHRPILESDIIHVRRADARDLDAILHVNPQLATKGLAMVYNPLDVGVTRTLTLPLYYTGLADKAIVREQDGEARAYQLNRCHQIELLLSVPARGLTWLTIE